MPNDELRDRYASIQSAEVDRRNAEEVERKQKKDAKEKERRERFIAGARWLEEHIIPHLRAVKSLTFQGFAIEELSNVDQFGGLAQPHCTLRITSGLNASSYYKFECIDGKYFAVSVGGHGGAIDETVQVSSRAIGNLSDDMIEQIFEKIVRKIS